MTSWTCSRHFDVPFGMPTGWFPLVPLPVITLSWTGLLTLRQLGWGSHFWLCNIGLAKHYVLLFFLTLHPWGLTAQACNWLDILQTFMQLSECSCSCPGVWRWCFHRTDAHGRLEFWVGRKWLRISLVDAYSSSHCTDLRHLLRPLTVGADWHAYIKTGVQHSVYSTGALV